MKAYLNILRLLALFLPAAGLCGCGETKGDLRWPWQQKESPIIRPSEVQPPPPGWEAEQLAQQPVPPPKPEPEPATRPASRPAEKPAPVVLGTEEIVAASMIQVNDRFITVDDVLKELDAKLAAIPAELPDDSFRRQAGLLIVEETRHKMVDLLVFGEAEKRLEEPVLKSVDKEVATFLKNRVAEAGGSRKKLEADLAREGKSLDKILDDYRRQLMIRAFLDARFAPSISVNRRMLWDYYCAHRSEFTRNKKVQMQIIAVPFQAFLTAASSKPTKAEEQAARAKAKEVVDQAVAALVDGEEFGEVAKQYSRGTKAGSEGVWPMMEKGSFRESKVEDAAFAIRQGQMCGPLETETGFYVVKALKVQAGRQVSFEDAQESIEIKLRQQQMQKLQEEYLTTLHGGATIVQSDRFVLLAINKAVEKYRRK